MGEGPLLGIFWVVIGPHATGCLLVRTCPLVTAEEYGDCLTFPEGHHDTWEGWRRRTLSAPASGLGTLFADTEYEEWPRGRVVLDRAAGRFILYADMQLRTGKWAEEIIKAFDLPSDQTDVRGDSHYRSTRRLPIS